MVSWAGSFVKNPFAEAAEGKNRSGEGFFAKRRHTAALPVGWPASGQDLAGVDAFSPLRRGHRHRRPATSGFPTAATSSAN